MTSHINLERLRSAAADFRYLLQKGYPRVASLTLVGNRYDLTYTARQLLHRGVFDPAEAERRRNKLILLAALGGRRLGLDGHNVLITLECGLRGLPLVAGDDGFIRDVGEVSGSYRTSAITDAALIMLAQYLREHRPGPMMVWYDAPLSRSGELASRTRAIFRHYHLAGDARTAAVPEKCLIAFDGPVATSDSALIDQVGTAVDVAGEIIRQWPGTQIISLGKL